MAHVHTVPVAAAARRRARPAAETVLWLFGAQAVIAVAMSASSTVSTAHVLLTTAVAGAAVLSRRPEAMALTAAYVVGVENLWRITGAEMPFAMPYYLLLLLLGGLVLTRGRAGISAIPTAYFGLLLPGAALAVIDIGMSEARERIAFSLLPHLLLTLAFMGFASHRLTNGFRRALVAAIVIPTAGMATVLLLRIASAGDIQFGASSNFAASGGFGPNRVAAALGLAVLLCVLEAARERNPALFVIEVAAALWFTAQCLLTFSRGGIVAALVGLVAAAAYAALRRGQLARAILVVCVTYPLLAFVVLPRLDNFTGGQLDDRFSNLQTERTALAQEDVALFKEHPVLGVGVGGAAFARSTGQITPSHTEYTRLLAEHGILGVIAMVLLAVMALLAIRRVDPAMRAQSIALLAWVLAQMTYANLRIAAVGLVFGLAGARTTRA